MSKQMENYEALKNLLDKIDRIYVCASVEGKGLHIGRIKGLNMDVEEGIIIEVDIDKFSTTTERSGLE